MPIDNDDLEDKAAQPSEVEGEAGKVKQHPLKDVAAVIDRAAANTAAGKIGFGLRVQQLKPGGCG